MVVLWYPCCQGQVLHSFSLCFQDMGLKTAKNNPILKFHLQENLSNKAS